MATLYLLNALLHVPIAENAGALHLLSHYDMHGKGIQWIDVHLLDSVLSTNSIPWTSDKNGTTGLKVNWVVPSRRVSGQFCRRRYVPPLVEPRDRGCRVAVG
jgi:hypothetical protein